jgi:cytochrome c oxidase cbb3-type subunit 3
VDDDLDAMDDGPPKGGGRGLLALLAIVGALVVAAVVGRSVLEGPGDDPPGGPAIGEGPAGEMLAEGKRLYEARCSSCHGNSGRGDGPIADSLQGPGPGDLTDDDWTHGDRPEQILKVIAEGVPGTTMAGWRSAFDEAQLRALTAYMYRLSGREVPDALLERPAGG